MVIDSELVRQKVNDLNRICIRIVDILAILERGTLAETMLDSVNLTASQINGLKANLELEGDELTTLSGEIKDMIK